MQNRNFRKILATASLLTLTSLSSTATAAKYTGTGGAVVIENGVATANSDGAKVSWVANDSFVSGTNDDVTFGGVVGADVATYDSNNQAPVNLMVAQSSKIGSIVNSGGVATSPLNIADGMNIVTTTINGINAKNQTQAGGNFSGLGAVTIGAGAEFVVGTNSTFANSFDSTVANNGSLTINPGMSALFTSDIGTNQILEFINISDNSTGGFSNNSVNANTIMLYNAASTAIFTDSTVNAAIEGQATGAGIIKLNNTVNVNASIGANSAVNAVYVADGTVNFNNTIATKNLYINKGTANLQNNVAGDIYFTADGILNIQNPLTIDGSVKTNQNNTGTLTFSADTSVKSVGSANLRLKSVEFNGGIVQFTNPTTTAHYATEYKFNNKGAILSLAGNHILDGKIVATTDDVGVIEFQGAGTINGIIGDSINSLEGIVSTSDTVKIIAGDHYVKTVGLYLEDNANAAFSLANNANIHGGIEAAGSNGSIIFEGNALVTEDVGENSFPINILNVNGAPSSKVLLSGNVYSNTTSINNGGTLELANSSIIDALNFASKGGVLNITGDADHAIGKVNIVSHTGNTANINVTSNVGTNANRLVNLGMVGDKGTIGAYLDLLKVSARDNNLATVVVGDNSYINTVELGANSALQLDVGSYKLSNVNPALDGNGKLIVNGNVTLESAANNAEVLFGNNTKKLESIELANNSVLTVGNNVNLYAAALNATSGNQITFNGTHKVFAPNSVALDSVNLATDGNLTLLSDFNANQINLGDNSILHITSKVTSSAGVNPVNNNGNVKVYFDNTSPITVEAKMGNTEIIDEVYLTGTDVTIANGNDIYSKKYIFATNTGAALGLGSTETSYSAAFSNTSGANVVNTIILNPNVTLTTFDANSSIATENNGARKLNVQLSDTSSAQILTTNTQGAQFTTSVDELGDLSLDVDGSVIYSAGTQLMRLGTVNFNENSEIKANLFATDASIAANKTVTLGETIQVTNGVELGSDSVLQLADGAILKSGVNGKGVLSVASASLENDIGTQSVLNAINFSSDAKSVAVISSNSMQATNINFNQGSVTFTESNENTSLGGDVTFNNANVNLLYRDVAIVGNLNFIGDSTLKLNTLQDPQGNENHGKLTIVPNSGDIIINSGATLKLMIDDTNYPRADTEKALVVIDNGTVSTVRFTSNDLTITNTNPFIGYTIIDNAGLVLNMVDSTQNIVPILKAQGLNDTEVNNMNLIIAAEPDTNAYDFTMLLSHLLDGQGGFKPEAIEAIRRLEPLSSNKSSMNALIAISSTILTRLNMGHSGGQYQSSGDEAYKYGAWVTPFMSGIERKALSTNNAYYSGYKGRSNGVIVGYDAQMQEDMMFGLALSQIHDNVTHRDYKKGDKTKSNMFGVSMYGMKQINDIWYTKALISYANNRIKNTENRMVVSDVDNTISYEKVNGKYNSRLFSAEALFGYDYQLQQNLNIDPVLGFKYTRIGGAHYTEFGGVEAPNLKVVKKPANRLDVILGATLTGKDYQLGQSSVVPEAHAFVNHALVNKNKNSTFEIEGAAPLSSFNGKIDRTQYNVGFSLNSSYQMMECGIGYDAYFSKKHTTHRGTLKLRINF